ncbi:MAG: DNA repair protein RecN [Gammaproteobacteria bacterium]|nr:DNA repair protein RecN [Gammaproteobacteria bacterium]
MLTHAHITDFAIIESLELDFDLGLTCLTGETGAGKSILIDALGLALGDRADATTVRAGADRAEISIGFDLSDQPLVQAWLEENELEDDGGECLVRRTVTSEGRSKAWINGRAVPMQSLKALGDALVDIHGQHEHQSLMRKEAQRELLDSYANHGELLEKTAAAHANWKKVREELTRLRDSQQESDDRRDLLRFQVGELDALALDPKELPELQSEQHRLAHASRLTEGTQRALDKAYESEDGSAYSLLADAVDELNELADFDDALQPISETLNSAMITLQEGAEELRRYAGKLELDPERRDEIEARLVSIQELARKHRTAAAELPELADALRTELDSLDNAEERIAELEAGLEKSEQAYLAAADALRASRQKVAKQLGDDVSKIMQELGMSGGRFEIAVEPDAKDRFLAHGRDQVEFRVSANPGQPLKPLAKVASGGELSRISLAIQVIASNASNMPVMIFDEVDAGVGGGIAELIGRRMRALGKERQVFCVTHLPQVAAQGHHHFKVEKTAGKDETHTGIRKLDDATRIEELARMLGGVNITDTTLDHAREMIKAATN